jgi:hypothetical protein
MDPEVKALLKGLGIFGLIIALVCYEAHRRRKGK